MIISIFVLVLFFSVIAFFMFILFVVAITFIHVCVVFNFHCLLHGVGCFLGFKAMESLVIISKIIIYPTKFPLEINCYGFTFCFKWCCYNTDKKVFNHICYTTMGFVDETIRFWKAINYIAIAWAFYTPTYLKGCNLKYFQIILLRFILLPKGKY